MDETSSWMMGKLSDDTFTYENGSNHASGEDAEEDCRQYGVKDTLYKEWRAIFFTKFLKKITEEKYHFRHIKWCV